MCETADFTEFHPKRDQKHIRGQAVSTFRQDCLEDMWLHQGISSTRQQTFAPRCDSRATEALFSGGSTAWIEFIRTADNPPRWILRQGFQGGTQRRTLVESGLARIGTFSDRLTLPGGFQHE